MTTVDESRELSPRQVRDIALRLFDEKGYQQTSLPEIADAAGISTERLTTMFPTKPDLIWVDIDRKYDQLVSTFQEYQGSGRIVEGIRAALKAVLDPKPSDQDHVAIGMETLDYNRPLHNLAEERHASHRHAIIKFIADELGLSPDDYTPSLVGETVWTASVTTTRYWAATQNVPVTLFEAVDAAVTPVLESYAALLKGQPSLLGS